MYAKRDLLPYWEISTDSFFSVNTSLYGLTCGGVKTETFSLTPAGNGVTFTHDPDNGIYRFDVAASATPTYYDLTLSAEWWINSEWITSAEKTIKFGVQSMVRPDFLELVMVNGNVLDFYMTHAQGDDLYLLRSDYDVELRFINDENSCYELTNSPGSHITSSGCQATFAQGEAYTAIAIDLWGPSS